METTTYHSVLTVEVLIPLRLRVSVLNFLNFFSEYARVVAQKSLFFEYSGVTQDSIHTLRLHLKSENLNSALALKTLLRGYLEKIFSDTPPVLQNNLNRYETDLFLILYKRSIADIRTDLRYTFNLLTDSEKTMLAEALITLSLTEESQQGASSLSDSVFTMLKNIDSLVLPSEPQVIPQSLLSGKSEL